MTTLLIATQPDEVRSLLAWARCVAISRHESLTVLLPQRKTGETRLVETPDRAEADEAEVLTVTRTVLATPVFRSSAESGDSTLSGAADVAVSAPVAESATPDVEVRILQLLGEHWQATLHQHVADIAPSQLILPAHTISKDQQKEDWQAALLETMECEVLLLQDDAVSFDGMLRVAVFLSHDSDNETALRYAVKMSKQFNGTATAVLIEPNVGDFAATVGRRQLSALLRRSVRHHDLDIFKRKVVVAAHPAEAFTKLKMEEFDLLLLGTTSQRAMRRFFASSPVDASTGVIPAMGVVRRGLSFSSRVWNKVDNAVQSFIPQLSREDRVSLVDRIQSSSQWDFDFVLLISLSTVIACLGLAESSGAVIVGAMLVAPLMTPIAGVGLGVAHANSFLTRVALRTALRGFATAIALGMLFGLFVRFFSWLEWLSPLQSGPELLFPREMENRMRPQFYDLLIALVSGVAAAYAMGRPNLFSALPGVAIAAALVPPIATSGIAFSYGEVFKGGGALLLFVTNMVTIILGTSLVFRAVGIRSQKSGANAASWPRYTLLLLVLLSMLVTVVIEMHQRSQ